MHAHVVTGTGLGRTIHFEASPDQILKAGRYCETSTPGREMHPCQPSVVLRSQEPGPVHRRGIREPTKQVVQDMLDACLVVRRHARNG